MRRAILAWHERSARDLPWRGARDPYSIWISEIMLQQTRAETAIPYYRAFIAAFQNVHELAIAHEQDVLKHWEGLGYYSRARNLQKAARVIDGPLGGVFPSDVQSLMALPGIGEYTAGAIASMAFGLPEPAIDGNQVRVLTRLFDIDGLTTRQATRRQIRLAALELIDRDCPGEFNQALMGLGALVCLPKKPRCEACPARAYCAASARGVQSQRPVLPARAAQKTQWRAVALVFDGARVLTCKREDEGLLAGLYEFPNFLGAHDGAAVREALGEWGVGVDEASKCCEHEHVFTHLVWRMTGYICRTRRAAAEPVRGAFVDAAGLRALAMPTAMKAFREAALEILEQREGGGQP